MYIHFLYIMIILIFHMIFIFISYKYYGGVYSSLNFILFFFILVKEFFLFLLWKSQLLKKNIFFVWLRKKINNNGGEIGFFFNPLC